MYDLGTLEHGLAASELLYAQIWSISNGPSGTRSGRGVQQRGNITAGSDHANFSSWWLDPTLWSLAWPWWEVLFLFGAQAIWKRLIKPKQPWFTSCYVIFSATKAEMGKEKKQLQNSLQVCLFHQRMDRGFVSFLHFSCIFSFPSCLIEGPGGAFRGSVAPDAALRPAQHRVRGHCLTPALPSNRKSFLWGRVLQTLQQQ